MNKTFEYRVKKQFDEQKAAEYDARPEWRHRPEMNLLEGALKLFPPGASVLDAPCGAGRVAVRMSELGLLVTAVDISPAMVTRAAEKLRPFGAHERLSVGEIEQLNFPDCAFDVAVCFRLFHHLLDVEVRRQVISELCRVSKDLVVISFFHPVSFHNLKRFLQAKWRGQPAKYFTNRPDELTALFSPHGFELVYLDGQSKYRRDLWLAAYKRRQVCGVSRVLFQELNEDAPRDDPKSHHVSARACGGRPRAPSLPE